MHPSRKQATQKSVKEGVRPPRPPAAFPPPRFHRAQSVGASPAFEYRRRNGAVLCSSTFVGTSSRAPLRLQTGFRWRFVTFLSTPLSTASPETFRRASFSLEMEFQGQRVSPSYGTNVNFAGNCQSAPSPPARRAEPNERGGRRQGVGEPSPTPQSRPLTTSAWQEQAPEPGRLCGEPGLSGQGQGPRWPWRSLYGGRPRECRRSAPTPSRLLLKPSPPFGRSARCLYLPHAWRAAPAGSLGGGY